MAKGSDIMSNKPYTSDAVGGFGYQTIIGAQPGEPDEGVSIMPADKKVAEQKKHAAAAIKIDARIEKVLSPEYAPAYASAARTKNKPKFLDHTMEILFGLADDDGIGGMVKSVAEVERDFGGLALLQRAMVRRLKERSTYMNRGWLSRLFNAEKRMDEFTQDEFKKFLEKVPGKNRKGDKDLQNKQEKGPVVPMAPQKPDTVVPGGVPAALLPPTATVSGLDIVGAAIMTGARHHRSGADIMTGARHHRSGADLALGLDPMVNRAVTGADLALGLDPMVNRAVTGADPMGNKAVTGANLMVGADPMGNKAVTGAEIFIGGSNASLMTGAALAVSGAEIYLAGDSLPDVKHAEAAAKIDERIASILKPYWGALYRIATLGKRMERKCAANSLMIAMLSDEGLPMMVKSMADVSAQFESVGLLQRAMARRLKECCSWGGMLARTGETWTAPLPPGPGTPSKSDYVPEPSPGAPNMVATPGTNQHHIAKLQNALNFVAWAKMFTPGTIMLSSDAMTPGFMMPIPVTGFYSSDKPGGAMTKATVKRFMEAKGATESSFIDLLNAMIDSWIAGDPGMRGNYAVFKLDKDAVMAAMASSIMAPVASPPSGSGKKLFGGKILPVYTDIKNLDEYQRKQFNDILNEDAARLEYLRRIYKNDPVILARIPKFMTPSSGGVGAGGDRLNELLRAFASFPSLTPPDGSAMTRAVVYGSSADVKAQQDILDNILGSYPVTEKQALADVAKKYVGTGKGLSIRYVGNEMQVVFTSKTTTSRLFGLGKKKVEITEQVLAKFCKLRDCLSKSSGASLEARKLAAHLLSMSGEFQFIYWALSKLGR